MIKWAPHHPLIHSLPANPRSLLEQMAKSLAVEKHVVFTGYVPEREKVDHYCLADAFVMLGRGEGFGIVYLEAMACGVPVVASIVDASREVVRDGELGTLVNPDDPHEIRIGILKALDRLKGAVPKELDDFTYSNFERRLHKIVDAIMLAADVVR